MYTYRHVYIYICTPIYMSTVRRCSMRYRWAPVRARRAACSTTSPMLPFYGYPTRAACSAQ